MFFGNLKIGVRLGAAFAALVLLLMLVAGIGISRLSNLNDEIDLMTNDRFPKTVWANEIIDSISSIARIMRNALLVNPENAAKELEAIPAQRKIILERLEKLEATIHSEKGIEDLKKVKEARTVYVAEQDKFLELIKSGKRQEATDYLLTTISKDQETYIQAVNTLVLYQSDLMSKSGKEALEAYEAARTLMVILAVIAALLAAVIGFAVTRSITRPLNAAVDVANKLAEGDLTVQVEVSGKDETGLMLMAMKNM
ncbi:MAG: MCP four helix bundle domain-containing protein, partial [Pseudomonadota bacterium]